MRDLTDQQEAFVAAFTSAPGAIGNGSEAARRAGYSKKSARDIARQLLLKPHIQVAIDQANRAQIGGSLASKAVEVLENIINDPEAPPKLKLDASKTILDRAGHIAPRAREPSKEGATELGLGALSVHELQALAAGMEAQREAEIAKTAAPRLVGGA